MCGKHSILFATIALLVCANTSPAPDPTRIIDDFEGYPFELVIHELWLDTSSGPSTAMPTLITGGVPQGLNAMDVDYSIAGGWRQPDNPANYDSWENAGVGREFDPLDFQPDGSIHFMIKLEDGWDISKVNYFTIEWGGDQWSQTWLPGPAIASSIMWWLEPSRIPAFIGPDGWDPWPGPRPIEWRDIPVISPDDGWVEVVINENMWMPWGSPLVDFDAMSSISLNLWSGWTDTSGASGNYKIDSTGGTHWPTGPLNGSIDFDYIYYIPEPTTIALLTLGGLALIRKMRNKQ